jgi:L-alanine-DL-glutamate epimerase-like enolase superfamily enzyme
VLRARLSAVVERLPMARAFAIARGTRSEAVVVVARVEWDGARGLGECTPYPRYGETPEDVRAEIEGLGPWLADAMEDGAYVARDALQDVLPPGAARNALDCALWDLEAKHSGRRVWEMAGTPAPAGLRSVLTLGIDAPEAMAQAARALPSGAIKIKLGAGDGADGARMAALRDARPDAWLMTDSNEGWAQADLPALLDAARAARIDLVEQPLPEGAEAVLERLRDEGAFDGLTLCADESCRKDADMAALARAFDAVNLKLDKTGGLTSALLQVQAARAAGLRVMVGCMLGSSLAMAPGAVLAAAAGADPVDLDGPLWLAQDREGGMLAPDGEVAPPGPALWG